MDVTPFGVVAGDWGCREPPPLPRRPGTPARWPADGPAADAAALLDAGAAYFFQVRAVGGAVSDVPADATAYGWREANLARLRALNRRYDPTGLFRDNFFIDPGAADSAA